MVLVVVLFRATFEGNGYQIRNLYVNRESMKLIQDCLVYLRRDGRGVVQNVGLVDARVKSRA